MAADSAYFVTSYLPRLYFRDHGFKEVRELAGHGPTITSAWCAQAEIVAAFHRAFREGRLNQEAYFSVLDQLMDGSKNGLSH